MMISGFDWVLWVETRKARRNAELFDFLDSLETTVLAKGYRQILMPQGIRELHVGRRDRTISFAAPGNIVLHYGGDLLSYRHFRKCRLSTTQSNVFDCRHFHLSAIHYFALLSA